jgi:hypothetical protein
MHWRALALIVLFLNALAATSVTEIAVGDQRPPRQRLRCVLGMLNSLEVKVLWPT